MNWYPAVYGASIVALAFLSFQAGAWWERRQAAQRALKARMAAQRQLFNAQRRTVPRPGAIGTARQSTLRYGSGPITGPRRES